MFVPTPELATAKTLIFVTLGLHETHGGRVGNNVFEWALQSSAAPHILVYPDLRFGTGRT